MKYVYNERKSKKFSSADYSFQNLIYIIEILTFEFY